MRGVERSKYNILNIDPEILKYLIEEHFHLMPMEDDDHVSEVN